MDSFTDKVAVVTGAGSGIGRALALRFAEDGADVVLADVQADALNESAALVEATGRHALPVVTDVSSPESVEALANATIERFGKVHVLCNNAGVGGGGLIADQQLVDWRWVIDVNIYGVIHGIHFFLPHLRAHGEQAHIVNTASVAGLYAGQGLGPYNASKFAVVAISETLHRELGEDDPLGVSVLCPGNVATNIATSQRNRPEHLRRRRKAPVPVPAADAATTSEATRTDARRRNDAVAAAVVGGMAPAELAQQVADAIRARRFWILTHPEYLPMVKERNDSIQELRNP